jgi:hypothetical protein
MYINATEPPYPVVYADKAGVGAAVAAKTGLMARVNPDDAHCTPKTNAI